MKFAICNETFQENGRFWEIERVFEYCARVGYGGVEIAPFTLAASAFEISAERRREIRGAAERAGVAVVGLHWVLVSPPGLYVNHPDEGIRRRTEDYLKELVRMCADLGGEVVVFGSPKQRSILDGWSSRQTWKRMIAAFRSVARVAEERGVYLLIEPLTTKETNMVISLNDGLDVVEEVGSDHFGLHLDVKAMAADSSRSVADTIRAAKGSRLLHFHANDPNLRGPGFGEMDFAPIFQALKEIGYDRWVSVEVFDYAPDPRTIAEKSLEYMKRASGEAGVR